MEKKSLGRGIEDIADIFMSQKKEQFPYDSSASENAKKTVGEVYHEHPGEDPEGTMPFSEDDIITDLSGKDENLRTRNLENIPEGCPDVAEFTQHVTRKKKLGYFNTPDVQKNIVKSLFQHLRQDFNIRRIELVKVDAVSRPGIKKEIEENISIYIKGEENR